MQQAEIHSMSGKSLESFETCMDDMLSRSQSALCVLSSHMSEGATQAWGQQMLAPGQTMNPIGGRNGDAALVRWPILLAAFKPF